MKLTIILSLLFISVQSMAHTAKNLKDPCADAIAGIMKVVASQNGKVMDIKIKHDSTHLKIIKTDPREDTTTYETRIDNGSTYQYWTIETKITDMFSKTNTCLIEKASAQ
jgi:hypothetical protein